jgi:hypothetical protein
LKMRMVPQKPSRTASSGRQWHLKKCSFMRGGQAACRVDGSISDAFVNRRIRASNFSTMTALYRVDISSGVFRNKYKYK